MWGQPAYHDVMHCPQDVFWQLPQFCRLKSACLEGCQTDLFVTFTKRIQKKIGGGEVRLGGGDPRLGSRSEGRCRRLTHQQTPKTRTTFFNDRLAGPKNPDSYSGRTPGRQVVSGTPTTAVLIGGWQSPRSYLHDYLSLPGGTLSIRTGAGQGAMAFSSSALGRMDCSPARMSAFSLACATRGWALGGDRG